jgi:hypothetical protein
LKDFKNFISIKNEPSAITALSTICLLFILILSASIVGLILNYLEVSTVNRNILELYKLTLQSEMVASELLAQTEQVLLAYQLAQTNTSGFSSVAAINQTVTAYLALGKAWQLSILPYKYFFDDEYVNPTTQYAYYLTGSVVS